MKTSLHKESGGIVIPRVQLSGPKASLKVNLILDTGAAYTMIGWDTAVTLGYTPSWHGRTVPIITANGKIHAPVIHLHKIAIQDISAQNVPVLCHDIPEIIEVSGLLGLSFLNRFRTTIDFRSCILEIE